MAMQRTMPSADAIRAALAEAHAKFKDDKEGVNASYIPALANVPSNLFGIAVVTADGQVFEVGDTAVLLRHRVHLQGLQHGAGDGGIGGRRSA